MPSPLASRTTRGRTRTTFPRSRRLKRRRLIQSLFDRSGQRSKAVSSGPVMLLFRQIPKNPSLAEPAVQIGFAVSRSAGNAVRRNRIKRLMREEYRACREEVEARLEKANSRFIVMAVLRNPNTDETAIRGALRKSLEHLIGEEISSPLSGSAGSDHEVELVT